MEIGISAEQIQELWFEDLCDRSDPYFYIMIKLSGPIWEKVRMGEGDEPENSVSNVVSRLNKSQLNNLYKDLIWLKLHMEKIEQYKSE